MSTENKDNLKAVKAKAKRTKKAPTMGGALLALGLLVLFVGIGYIAFGLKVDIMLVLAAIGVGIMAYLRGYTYEELENFIVARLGKTMSTIMLVWCIGMVIGTFMVSGSIPMIIYYGINLIDPALVIPMAFILCAIFSTVTGTSWGSAGTAGVALIGIAASLGVSLPMTAAAIICGATFGDKLSPLSDSTNLAPACAGSKLYDHIVSMMWTTLPASIIALIGFFIMGQMNAVEGAALPAEAVAMSTTLEGIFNWGILPIIPFVIILAGALLKKPPIPTMLAAAFSAILIGVFYQDFTLQSAVMSAYSGFKMNMVGGGFDVATASPMVSTLLVRGGITAMTSMVIIIFAGYSYVSILSGSGYMERITRSITQRIKNKGLLMTSALITDFLLLAISGTVYVSALCLPDIFKRPFLENGMPPRVLSRTIEDGATIMAPLIPWGTSGVFYATTLGVAAWGSGGYALFALTCWLTPIIAIILASTGIGMYKMSKEQIEVALKEYDAQNTVAAD